MTDWFEFTVNVLALAAVLVAAILAIDLVVTLLSSL